MPPQSGWTGKFESGARTRPPNLTFERDNADLWESVRGGFSLLNFIVGGKRP